MASRALSICTPLVRHKTAASVSHLSRILEAWRVSIPKADRPPDGRTISEVAKIPRDSNTKLDLFFRYAEAAFAIHRWSSVLRCRPSGPVEVMEAYSMSQKHCLNLSKGIIDLTNTFHTNDAEIDWSNVYLPLLSASFIFMAITKNEVGEDHLPYLGMVSGYFARLSSCGSTFRDLSNGVSHLARIAQSEVQNMKDSGCLQGKSVEVETQQGEVTYEEDASAETVVQHPNPVLDVQHSLIPMSQNFDFLGNSLTDSFDLPDSYQFFNDQDFTMTLG